MKKPKLDTRWDDADCIRYQELLPIITSAVVATNEMHLTDKSMVGRTAVLITYGVVCAEKECRGEFSFASDGK